MNTATKPRSLRRWIALSVWLLSVIVSIVIIARTSFTTDLSGFLPQSPTKEQQVLLDQLKEGVVSRLILVGIEGGDSAARASVSKDMAAQLRQEPAFVTVNNGEPVNMEKDQAFLFGNRYLLSPAVTPERFTAEGLHEAIGETIDLLASPAGLMMKSLVKNDPTGDLVQLLERMNSGSRPRTLDGAWASRDGQKALLLVQTRAAGADIDGQQQAMEKLQQAFKSAVDRQGQAAGKTSSAMQVVMTGPGVFSVESRNTIEKEASRLSIISAGLIITLLLLVYRSFPALVLGLLPVVSGALAGIVAVSLGFGMVHGVTLGFGATLIGEAVDYAIYLFIQSRQKNGSITQGEITGNDKANGDTAGDSGDWVSQLWPTIRLGVLTSVVGFASLLFSSFPGLAQLGVYSIAGLVTAALVTRYILPPLLPQGFFIRDLSALGAKIASVAKAAPRLRWPLLIVLAIACVVLVQHRDSLWNAELSSLSPVPQKEMALDASLRADLGAPDVRYMIVVSAADRETALQSAEAVSSHLDALVEKGVLAGFESPSRYLPSMAAQRARQASLPSEGLEQRLQQAVNGLPVKKDIFEPFIHDVKAAKARAPLERADLDNTSFALAVDSLLFRRGETGNAASWNAVLPLTAPAGSQGLAVEPIRAMLAAAGQQNAVFVDLKAESDNLYSSYLGEALQWSLVGLAGIVVLLFFSLRSVGRVVRVMIPLVAAVITVVAILAASGQRLTILHLIGLLLIVAVGSNYALFFSSGSVGESGEGNDANIDVNSAHVLTSLLFANLTTVTGFGILGFSSVPVLNAIGMTVSMGAVLALIFAATFAVRPAAKTMVKQPAAKSDSQGQQGRQQMDTKGSA